MLLAPVVRRQKGEFRDVIERLAREGFVRAGWTRICRTRRRHARQARQKEIPQHRGGRGPAGH